MFRISVTALGNSAYDSATLPSAPAASNTARRAMDGGCTNNITAESSILQKEGMYFTGVYEDYNRGWIYLLWGEY
jgi:hypothetical protein